MSVSTTGMRTVFAAAVGLLSSVSTAPGQAEVYVGTNLTPVNWPTAPLGQQPVLFVHGHNLGSANDSDFNYRKNFHDDPGAGLTSFQQTLDEPDNAWLGIEPYYIRFQDQHRSIVEDADEIADVIEQILQRHDPSYTPGMSNPTTQVRVAIIAFSKGTISSRLYLKNLGSGFNPVSEFVALSPPNHGLDVAAPSNEATKQLNNGCSGCVGSFCVPLSGSDVADFIQRLNDHSIGDTKSNAFVSGAHFDSEAPGSRPNGAPLAAGTLYTCLYANAGRDFVGGNAPSNDCQGRVLAANLATHAVNREVASIPGGNPLDVHPNTPHTPEVICRALATVAHHRAPPEVFTCTLVGEVPLIPPRTAVELVLDLSGSMLAPASPGGATRLSVLKQAVEIFCQLYAAFAGPGDRLGAVFFGTQASEFPLAGEALFPVTDDNVLTFGQDLINRNTVPTELTALGKGLSAAIGALTGPAASGAATRHIVLFTDGMQNVPPMVSTSPPLSIATTPPTPLDATLGVTVHTIGIGAASPFVELLEHIASQTGGENRTTIDAAADLQQFFAVTLIDALQHNSPQLVDYRHGAFAGASVLESFSVGAGGRKLVLELSWRGKGALRFEVEKDGADVTALGRFVEGSFYRLFVVDLAASAGAAGVTSAGNWAMRITGDANVPYEVAAIVDEPRLEVDATLPRPSVHAGEPIELRVELRVDGVPLQGAATVRAIVVKPRESAGNLLAQSAGPAEPPSFSLEGADAAQKKLALLLAEERNWQRLQGERSTIELLRERAGVYAGAFRAADVPGLYRIEVEAEGDSPATGAFRRRQTLVALVRFGAVDAGASKLRITEIARGAGARTLELSLRPRDVLGNFLGPGWGSLIAVTLDGKRLDATPRDELDGTYVVSMAVPESGDPALEIAVDSKAAYAGAVSGVGNAEPAGRSWITIALVALLALVLLVIAWRVIKSLQKPQ